VQFGRYEDLKKAGYAGWSDIALKGSRFMHVDLVKKPFFDGDSEYALEVLERAVAVFKEANPGKLDGSRYFDLFIRNLLILIVLSPHVYEHHQTDKA